MGTFYYGGGHGGPPIGFDIDDSLLIPLKQVIIAKLRRGESFLVTVPALDHGLEVREALWMNPAVPLRFVIHETASLPPDRDRLEALMRDANTPRGIALTP
jgi:hypothetical protein